MRAMKCLAISLFLVSLLAAASLTAVKVESDIRSVSASLSEQIELTQRDVDWTEGRVRNLIADSYRERHARMQQHPNSDLYNSLQAVSVRVDVGRGTGTGVLVTRRVGDVYRTFVWTAGHVAAGLRNDDGTFRPGTVYREQREGGLLTGTTSTEAIVVAYSDADAGDDLALLEIQQDNFSLDNANFVQTDVPEPVGRELIHVGCTLGLYNSVSRGVMSQTDRDLLTTGRAFDQTSCIGFPGSSGGGVYRLDGECVGLLVRGVGPGLNFIVPVRRMRAWAEKMQVTWALDSDVPVPVARAQTPIDDGASTAPSEIPGSPEPTRANIDKRITHYAS